MTEGRKTIVGEIDAKSRADAASITATAEKVGRREIEQAERRSKTRLDAAARELDSQLASERGLAEATAAARAARMQLEARQELVASLLGSALERLASAPRDDAYLAILERLAGEAVGGLGSKDASLVFSAGDRDFLNRESRGERLLRSVGTSTGVWVSVSADTVRCAGGVIARSGDGRVSYYNTFEEIAYRRRSELRALIAKALFE